MFRASDFAYIEVISITDGEKIGFVSDVEFDGDNGKISSIIVPSRQKRWFQTKDKGIKIPWENVKKIGDDIILVDYTINYD